VHTKVVSRNRASETINSGANYLSAQNQNF
jgi:hypothetical protein